jgi:hypothetical protein
LGAEQLVKNKPKFYRVRLQDGTQGYVLMKKSKVVQ